MTKQFPRNGEPTGYTQSRKVVFIGDDEAMLNVVTLSIRLRWPDVAPLWAANADQGLELVEELAPEIVIISTRHPDAPPATVVKEMRQFSGVPILVLSRSENEFEAVTCLEAGADDFIRFPCSMMEIMARMWASLRRAGLLTQHNGSGHPVVSGELLINPATYEVFLSNRRVSLTATEFRLLHLLAKNRGTVVSHQSMEQSLWGERSTNPQVAKKYIQRLRSKLGDSALAPQWIASVPGVEYRFIGPRPCPQGSEAAASLT
jgi:two-component system, OmpR family, KDP operon response regulator KdpE